MRWMVDPCDWESKHAPPEGEQTEYHLIRGPGPPFIQADLEFAPDFRGLVLLDVDGSAARSGFPD